MPKPTDIRVIGAGLYFLPVQTRVPLKFGPEILTEVTCARVRVTVADNQGQTAEGWGETPLSVQWVWPSTVSYSERHDALKGFCIELAELWAGIRSFGHPIELGYDFLETVLPGWLDGYNQRNRRGRDPMPWLAALVCCSAFDLATHDAYGQLHGRPVYETYNAEFMNRDLGYYLKAVTRLEVGFHGKYPSDFLASRRADHLVAWHLVGGLDLLKPSELTHDEPDDGYPVLLADWIQRDGLKCLKVK